MFGSNSVMTDDRGVQDEEDFEDHEVDENSPILSPSLIGSGGNNRVNESNTSDVIECGVEIRTRRTLKRDRENK
jgi:hypothetical protein